MCSLATKPDDVYWGKKKEQKGKRNVDLRGRLLQRKRNECFLIGRSCLHVFLMKQKPMSLWFISLFPSNTADVSKKCSLFFGEGHVFFSI